MASGTFEKLNRKLACKPRSYPSLKLRPSVSLTRVKSSVAKKLEICIQPLLIWRQPKLEFWPGMEATTFKHQDCELNHNAIMFQLFLLLFLSIK